MSPRAASGNHDINRVGCYPPQNSLISITLPGMCTTYTSPDLARYRSKTGAKEITPTPRALQTITLGAGEALWVTANMYFEGRLRPDKIAGM